ncbi:hypothetical protein [Dyadobacter sediminis]|uniref:Uncharacterized protein n=1 Tax=Dyadobacter sediminis TaxID=1493691 RepID=A0A5R9KAZ0_9BACT|nr:hypothetical protein [Dyadobacter sediminis]TLU91991.1 hypothetical protein FEM55_14620 [Dyadobacter sediminis]GGB98422.1 hypothetical protein GCM10011325_27130 [Dyadobacter sediminis]
MKVEKQVGWIKGLNGIGNVFELSHNGKYLLACIWQDNKFHFLDAGSLIEEINQGTASLAEIRESYLHGSAVPINADGSLTVSNPDGWQRLYQPATGNSTEATENLADELNFPVSISFTGSVKVKLEGLSQILKFIE